MKIKLVSLLKGIRPKLPTLLVFHDVDDLNWHHRAGYSKHDREGLYDSLSAKGNLSFATMARVLDALGYRLGILPKSA